jgi:hypothetical protein
MFQYEATSVRTHDLLEIDATQFLSIQASVPAWAERELRRTPFLVVRRGGAGHAIPVGIRGPERNQRWAAFCEPKLVKSILSPPQLLRRTVPAFRRETVPALTRYSFSKIAGQAFTVPGDQEGASASSGNPPVA